LIDAAEFPSYLKVLVMISGGSQCPNHRPLQLYEQAGVASGFTSNVSENHPAVSAASSRLTRITEKGVPNVN
jgi:hypothetical protein